MQSSREHSHFYGQWEPHPEASYPETYGFVIVEQLFLSVVFHLDMEPGLWLLVQINRFLKGVVT